MAPKQITVLGKTYTITLVDDISCGETMGSCRRHSQTICINEELAKDQSDETLLHEVIHIIDGELVLGLTEETVARLAVGLYSAGYRWNKK